MSWRQNPHVAGLSSSSGSEEASALLSELLLCVYSFSFSIKEDTASTLSVATVNPSIIRKQLTLLKIQTLAKRT